MLNYIIWNVNPAIIEGFGVRWYGLFFALGFFVSYTMLNKILVRDGLKQKEVDNFTFLVFVFLIVGLRLGHCLFYEPAEYLANPIRILYIWEGGLASHGGAIGILLAFLVVVRKSKYSYATVMARAMLVVPLAAFFIRMGNLMNSEIYGVPTNVPWGFVFTNMGETLPKHPTQIYEGLAYLFTFGILQYYAWKQLRAQKKLSHSFIMGVFLIGIFFTRFLIEFIKEPQVLFETTMLLNMGQLLSIPFFLCGFFLLWKARREKKITLS